MSKEKLEFYPIHPSRRKTHVIEKSIMPDLSQSSPFNVLELLNELNNNLSESLKIYEDKRFEVEGIVTYIGPDIHHKPSLKLSNSKNGKCCALTIFPKKDFYKQVSLGDKVIVKANYLVLCNLFGVVMKNSELIKVVK